MLEFYEFNTLNISIVLISTFIIYYLLIKYFNNDNDKKKSDDNTFSLEYLIISIIVSIGISIVI